VLLIVSDSGDETLMARLTCSGLGAFLLERHRYSKGVVRIVIRLEWELD